MNEYAKTIQYQGRSMLSIIHSGCKSNDTAVVLLVGGPQYRVGSHRQFVQLSRTLATQGFTSMRFDYSGMGDSFGEKLPFDERADEVRTAIDTLFRCEPHIKKVCLWGLCDAASMALIYGWQDLRVKGLILLNPWLENDAAKAKAILSHYYIRRLFSRDFWHKLFSGNVSVSASVKEINQLSKISVSDNIPSACSSSEGYQESMLTGLKKFEGKVTFILSGNDLTAQIFEQQVKQSRQWNKLILKKTRIYKLPQADHTFSRKLWKAEVEALTLQVLKKT